MGLFQWLRRLGALVDPAHLSMDSESESRERHQESEREEAIRQFRYSVEDFADNHGEELRQYLRQKRHSGVRDTEIIWYDLCHEGLCITLIPTRFGVEVVYYDGYRENRRVYTCGYVLAILLRELTVDEIKQATHEALETLKRMLACELEAASVPEGRGTEPESAAAPLGNGAELISGQS